MDSGFPKCVSGKLWSSVYKDSLKELKCVERIGTHEEKNWFKCGPSQAYKSKQYSELPIKIGSKDTVIQVSLVDTNIPSLLGKDYLAKWEYKQDYSENTLKFGVTGETVKLYETLKGGLYTFNLIED